MASADFSQFVVTTAHETACETSPVKVRSLSLHAPAASTRTSDNFWTSVSFATLSAFPSLICGSCPSGQRFAYSFFQIPPHDGHPCCSAMYFVVVYAHSGLSPVRERPCRANKSHTTITRQLCGKKMTESGKVHSNFTSIIIASFRETVKHQSLRNCGGCLLLFVLLYGT